MPVSLFTHWILTENSLDARTIETNEIRFLSSRGLNFCNISIKSNTFRCFIIHLKMTWPFSVFAWIVMLCSLDVCMFGCMWFAWYREGYSTWVCRLHVVQHGGCRSSCSAASTPELLRWARGYCEDTGSTLVEFAFQQLQIYAVGWALKSHKIFLVTLKYVAWQPFDITQYKNVLNVWRVPWLHWSLNL